MAYFNGTNAPTITLEMQLVTTWTAVTTTDIKSISVRRGRTREDQNYQPGTLTVIFDNISGVYNPDNQTSPYFVGGRTYLDAHTAIRLKATWNSTTYIIYNGFIEDVQVDVSLAPVTTIIATDALAFFARTKLALPALPGTETVHDRITTILGNFNVNWMATDIGTGNRDVVVQDETLDVLSLLEEAAACEFGRFWIDREGTAYFRNWDEIAVMPYSFNLTDYHNLNTIEYDLINTEPGSRYRINSVNITGNNLSTASGSDTDTASVSAYGVYAKEYSIPLSTDADCDALAAQIVGRFADPFTRVNHIEFEAVGMENLWDSILTTDLNYLVNVNRTTVDGFKYQVGGLIEGLNFDITPESWRYSLELSDFFYSPEVEWTVNGSAFEIENGFTFVTGSTNQAGTAWSNKYISVPFTIDFTFNESSPLGGDGFAFGVTETSTPPTFLGATGGGQGFVNSSGYRIRGVSWDNWRNLPQPTRGTYQDPLTGTFDTDDVITVSGDEAWTYTTYWEPTTIGDGASRVGTHNCRIIATATTITVIQDNVTILTSSDLSGKLPTGSMMFGFGAATGSSVNTISITNIAIL